MGGDAPTPLILTMKASCSVVNSFLLLNSSIRMQTKSADGKVHE